MIRPIHTNTRVAPARNTHNARTSSKLSILDCFPQAMSVVSEVQERLSIQIRLGARWVSEVNHDNKLGEYKTSGKILGKGQFGCVLAAIDPTGKPVAIKKMKLTKHGIDPVQEGTLMKTHGHHPNIVPLIGSMISNTHCYLVMPRATMDLDTLMATSVFEKQPDALQQATKGILQGLYHLHKMGVAHLDLKTDNILVSTTALDFDKQLIPGRRITADCFQLSDFGCAESCPKFNPNTVVEMAPENAVPVKDRRGALCAMAPEMVLGRCEDGRLADMWAVGSILFFFLDGESEEDNERLQRKFVRLARQARAGKKESRQYVLYLTSFVDELEAFQNKVPCQERTPLHELVIRLFTVDPRRRITAGQALKHAFVVVE